MEVHRNVVIRNIIHDDIASWTSGSKYRVVNSARFRHVVMPVDYTRPNRLRLPAKNLMKRGCQRPNVLKGACLRVRGIKRALTALCALIITAPRQHDHVTLSSLTVANSSCPSTTGLYLSNRCNRFHIVTSSFRLLYFALAENLDGYRRKNETLCFGKE